MARAQGIAQVGWLDCAGGGQVVVEGTTAFIGHMSAPSGTSIVDVADPKHPRVIATIDMPPGTHSHKVRVSNGVMLVNHEITDPAQAQELGVIGGLALYDVSNPAQPRAITRWTCGGLGVHRFTFDGRYAYISPDLEGYRGNIVMILDCADPAHPREVGRWWMPGQWEAGGEVADWSGRSHRCHHPIRLGDRLFVSYWHGGFVILDIADMSRPTPIGRFDTSPPYPWPTHTAVPIPFLIDDRHWLLVCDEDVDPLDPAMRDTSAAFLWMFDITDPARPVPVSSFQVEGVLGRLRTQGRRAPIGCHQCVETIRGTEIPVAWFGSGMRCIDFANPYALRETACYVPDPPAGRMMCSTNDVFVDDRGLIYAIDRNRGLSILERC